MPTQAPQCLSTVQRHPIWRTVLWVLGLGAFAFCVNAAGAALLGSTEQWTQWIRHHWLYLLLWRLGLYSLTVWGWLRMRRRIREAQTHLHVGKRLLRAEVAAVTAVVMVEVIGFLQRS